MDFYCVEEIEKVMNRLNMSYITPYYTDRDGYINGLTKGFGNQSIWSLMESHQAIVIVEEYAPTELDEDGARIIKETKITKPMVDNMLFLESISFPIGYYDNLVYVSDNVYGRMLKNYLDGKEVEPLDSIINPVYVTFKNSNKLDAVYIDKNEARRSTEEKDMLHVIDTIELQGSFGKEKFNYEITKDCKYYSPKLEAIRIMISSLYEMDGCSCGGLCHIVTDDNNFDDDSLQVVINECDREENADRVEQGLVKLICQELLSLSIQERALLFSSYYAMCLCDNECKTCNVEDGRYELF